VRLETKAGDDITKNPCEQDHPPGASRQTFEGWKSQDRIEAEWPKSRHKVESENPGEAGQQNPCCEVKGRRTAEALETIFNSQSATLLKLRSGAGIVKIKIRLTSSSDFAISYQPRAGFLCHKPFAICSTPLLAICCFCSLFFPATWTFTTSIAWPVT